MSPRDFYVIRGQELWNNGGGRESRAASCHLLDGGGCFCCSYYSTDFTRQCLQLYTVVVGWRIYVVERSGQLRLCLTPTASPGKSNLVNTTVDGQIPIGEGDPI